MSEPESPPPGGRNAEDGAKTSRSREAELSERLARLNVTLGSVRSRKEAAGASPARDTSSKSGVALAFRLGAEFVSGVLVGSAIGYGIDYLFSISPWGLITFTLIGFGAGVANMMRAAGEGPSRGRPKS